MPKTVFPERSTSQDNKEPGNKESHAMRSAIYIIILLFISATVHERMGAHCKTCLIVAMSKSRNEPPGETMLLLAVRTEFNMQKLPDLHELRTHYTPKGAYK
eukprot:4306591-Amphidinium_carterae.1